MSSKSILSKVHNFKLRKIVQYSLITSILLIQIAIAGFFYNEFISKKNLSFIEKQLKEVDGLESLTDDFQKQLYDAQDYFQKYIKTEDDQYLKSYFTSVNNLNKNLDKIQNFKSENPKLKNFLTERNRDSAEIKNLKILIDSSYQFSTRSNYKIRDELPKLKKYSYDYDFGKFDIQTQTFSDTIAKKGIFGRLKDAVSGKVNVRKDSTVVTVKQAKTAGVSKIKTELDSIVNLVNNHYSKEVQKIQLSVIKNQNKGGKLYADFSELLVYSNQLMGIYKSGIKVSKAELEKEYANHNSINNKIRQSLVLGLMILMFIVSILIMYFTRIAFIYEWKLNAANKQIRENLNFKNRILGMLSHELRSPLKMIGIFINRINKKTNDESIKDYLKSITFTNNTLLMQANQILEYTKNQQVQNRLVPAVFNLKNEIHSILTAIAPYIETRNNTFITDESIDPEIVVYSDNTKINQIFMNILGNANKFTENGQIAVSTTAKQIDENTISLTVKISDTGAGISKSDLEKIFEPYYQGILSDEVDNLGAGLGLSLCKEIVELFSGNISVSSVLNEGTTVFFSINLKRNK